MLPPLPRRSGWAYCFAHSPSRISLPRKGCRVGLRIVLFEACSAFTRVAACTLALSPIRDPLSEGFSHFVTSMAAPVASGWSGCRVGLAPTGKRRLSTAHTRSGHSLPGRLQHRRTENRSVALPARPGVFDPSPCQRRVVHASQIATKASTTDRIRRTVCCRGPSTSQGRSCAARTTMVPCTAVAIPT